MTAPVIWREVAEPYFHGALRHGPGKRAWMGLEVERDADEAFPAGRRTVWRQERFSSDVLAVRIVTPEVTRRWLRSWVPLKTAEEWLAEWSAEFTAGLQGWINEMKAENEAMAERLGVSVQDAIAIRRSRDLFARYADQINGRGDYDETDAGGEIRGGLQIERIV